METVCCREASTGGLDPAERDDDPVNQARDPVNQRRDPVTENDDPVDDDWSDPVDRQRWVMAELRRGRQLRAPEIVARLGCSATTIKRDLELLRDAGQVKFVGPRKTGHYRLKGVAKPR